MREKLKKPKNNTLIIIFLILVLIDQLTKTILTTPIDLGIIAITPITNTGMSFGLLQGNNTLLAIISIVFIALIILFRKEFKNKEIQLTMILAGATGNLIDRIIHGHVLDFINFKIFPIFNVADTLIVLGITSIIYLEIKEEIKIKRREKKINKS